MNEFPAGQRPQIGDQDEVTEIVATALECDVAQRTAYVARACAGREAVREEVEALLAIHDADPGADFLALSAAELLSPQSAPSSTPEDADSMPTVIGCYRILGLLGKGGMGVVYLAEQDQPVRRRLALKVIRVLYEDVMRRRFEAECQALARLNHPHIAAMYEVGTTDEQSPLSYVAMEWVDGAPINRWCDRERLTVEERIKLFLGVCAGIAHAHERGVLHCDLKPSNVLVTSVDGRAEAKVIDFGIARAIDEPLLGEGEGDATREMVLGSPPYISPEAMTSGGRHHLDVRTDVYSLGLLLYELVAGALPFDHSGVGVWAWLQHVNRNEPLLPSKRFRELSAERAAEFSQQRAVDSAQLVRRIGGDIDAIVGKAIERDPKRRYESVSAFAADLRRHLAHEPIQARAPTTGYLAARFVRRHLGAVAAALLLVGALVAGLVARTIEADRAKQALAESEEVREFMVELFSAADPQRAAGAVFSVRELLDQGTQRLRDGLADQPLARARFLHTIGSVYTRLGEYESAAHVIGEALELREANLPVGHAEIVESTGEIGVIYRRLGRYEESEELLRSVLQARSIDHDIDPELLADAHSNLGNLYWSQQRFEEAETAHRAALALRERNALQRGDSQSRLDEARSANNLGVMLYSRRQYERARPLLLRAIEVWRAEKTPLLGSSLNNLGLVEHNLSTWTDAEALFRESAAVVEANVGPTHARALNPRRNLIIELSLRHRWDAAQAEATQAVANAEKSDDLITLTRVIRLKAITEMQAGAFEAALRSIDHSVRVIESVHPSDHHDALWSRGTRSRILARMDRIDEALNDLLAVADIQANTLPATHASRLRTARYLGEVYLRADRAAEAEPYLRQVERSALSKYGENDISYADALGHLAEAVDALGQSEDASMMLQQALATYERILGPRHPGVAALSRKLAKVKHSQGEQAASIALLVTAVAIQREHFPAADLALLESIEELHALRQLRDESGADSRP